MSTHSVWAEEAGPQEAPVVALVHGSMDRSAGLLKLSRRLDTGYRVLRYDRRGYGRSAPHDGPFTVADQVDDLLRLLAGRRALLVGHSYGGNVTLATAARVPEQVVGVVVFETPLSWFDWWPGTTAGARALATEGEPEEAAERFLRRLIGDERWERLPPSSRAARRAEGVAMVGELTALRQGPPWDPTEVHAPVLALYGEHGAPHHRQAMQFLGDLLPDCQVAEVAGSHHFGPNSHPDEVAELVTAFARGCGWPPIGG